MNQSSRPLESAATLEWQEHGRIRSALWAAVAQPRPPRSLRLVDDQLRADTALELAQDNVGLLWRGDYRNARQLLDAFKRRLDRRQRKANHHKPGRTLDAAELFRRHRQQQARRAWMVSRVLVELSPDYEVVASHAPGVARACRNAWGPATQPLLVPLQDLLGAIGAEQWRRRGVFVEALQARIHPHYDVFAPTRSDYLNLVAETELPPTQTAFDIGTGTGVLAALLARRGVSRVQATDSAPRAVDCARDNIDRLGLTDRVEVCQTGLFPTGRADLVVCNPPWLPGKPSSPLEAGVYDHRGRMLADFLAHLPGHLTPNGQAWLVLSDLAERLGLRGPTEVSDRIHRAGLQVAGTTSTLPQRPPGEEDDPIAAARAAETVTLWRLQHP